MLGYSFPLCDGFVFCACFVLFVRLGSLFFALLLHFQQLLLLFLLSEQIVSAEVALLAQAV